MKVKYFNEGITVIKKEMVDKDTDVVFFPHSLKVIEEGACVLDNHSPYSFFYSGTLADWQKVNVGNCNSICKINFLSGSYVIHV